MCNPSVHDVAAYLLQYFNHPITTMKLQKLAFFSQGWSLGLLDEPLFQEEFQAWRHGPVCYELYQRHRGQYFISDWRGNPDRLGAYQKRLIDGVLQNYGALSGSDLSELTHKQGTPWSTTRSERGLRDGAWADDVIDKGVMQSYFRQQLLNQNT
ncbi:Panacea domain-containing protein [Corynebacterium sp. NML130628]|uniref:Panacea domain-containing protein n=1 Tax=Corynebacterium sp. NML130628 TaxID=1906333 RepID=UPI0008FB348C|nr:type II toxin-antitoxin system antitoxin SocA domain-containing protein [Corynebacterium sp. NML130628]OIR45756.1 hypothetical protein BJP07_02500 [Corynebacterium sp. NML130628]